jgi:hypothetical protein
MEHDGNFKKHKRILSFDVGMRNLAFCSMTFSCSSINSCNIEDWDVIDLGPNVRGVEKCATLLTKALDEKFGHMRTSTCYVDYVLIERQPKQRSIIMVAIQMFLCEYFTVIQEHHKMVGKVVFVSAKEKLKICDYATLHYCTTANDEEDSMSMTFKQRQQRQRRKYSENKKVAISTTKHFLEHVIKDFGNLVIFTDMHAKKDDLADSLLQGVSFFKSTIKHTM